MLNQALIEAQLGETIRPSFRRLLADARENEKKRLNEIYDYHGFFFALDGIYADVERVGDNHDIALIPEGLVSINNELDIHPVVFMNMSENNRHSVLRLTRNFHGGQMDLNAFELECQPLTKDEKIKFKQQRDEIRIAVVNAFGGLRRKIRDWYIFRNLRPYHMEHMKLTLDDARKGNAGRLAVVARLFALRQNCQNYSQLIAMAEFINSFVNQEIGKNMSLTKLSLLTELSLNNNVRFRKLNEEFENLLAIVRPLNENSEYKFECDCAATYHVYKHSLDPDFNIPCAQRYFDTINKLFKNDETDRVDRLTQEGDAIKTTYRSQLLTGVLIRKRDMNNPNVFGRSFVITTFTNRR